MILSWSAQYRMIATNVDVNGSKHGPGVVTFEFNIVLGNFAMAQPVCQVYCILEIAGMC